MERIKEVACLEEFDIPAWDRYDLQEYEGVIDALEDFANNADYEGF